MSWRLSVLLLLSTGLAAQTDDQVVPMRQERYHRLLFENPQVAVFDVVFPPGATMSYHEHPTDHLAVVIAPGTLRNEVKGAAAAVRPPGPKGELVFLPAGPPHRQINVGTTTVHFVAAEILGRPAQVAGAPAALPAGGACVQELDNAVVRALRCTLAPGQAPAALSHAGAFLRVVIAGDRLEWRTQAGARGAAQVEPGLTTWHVAAEAGTLANPGTQALETLDIEWK
jgi:quercetin dioxygenase-like cupin family protein